MSSFDSFFVGTIIFGIILFALGIIVQEIKNRLKFVFCGVALIVVIGAMVFLAYHYEWESSLLRIPEEYKAEPLEPEPLEPEPLEPEPIHTKMPIESMLPSTEPSTKPSEPTLSDQSDFSGATVSIPEIDDVFLKAVETHSPNDGITGSVEFRDWSSETDFDLRKESHFGKSSYFISYSNMFNILGGNDSDRIVSNICFQLKEDINADLTNLYLTGFLVAECRTQGSNAYADVAVIADGIEKWRSSESITSNTIKPVKFAINASDIKSEVVVQISCAPLESGLALGLVDLQFVMDDGTIEDTIQLENISSEDERYLFNNAFMSCSPRNDGVNQTWFGNWDTLSNADLRGEQYGGNQGGQILLKMSNTLNSLGASSDNPIIVDVHLAINPRKDIEGLVWSGSIVAEQSTQGSEAFADVVILVDDVEKWRTTESITGSTIPPFDFEIDMSEAKYEVIIRVTCRPLGEGLALGIVNMNLGYN